MAAGGFALSVLLRVLAGVAKKLSRRMWGVCRCVSTLVSRPAIAVNYVRMVRQSAISAIHIRPGPVRLAIPDSFSSGSSTKRVRASVYVSVPPPKVEGGCVGQECGSKGYAQMR